MTCRVRVDPAQAGDLNVDAGLLADLAPGGFDHGLAEVLGAARQRPQAVVGPLDQQELAPVVSDGCGDGDDDAVGLGCGRVVVVVPLRRIYLLTMSQRVAASHTAVKLSS
jgi:hypothetical protein